MSGISADIQANNFNRFHKVLSIGAGLALSSLAISGCSPTHAEERKDLLPSERYVNDFIASNGNSSICLRSTPYDYERVIVTQEGPDSIIVTPTSKTLQSLHFKGYQDRDYPLQSSDKYTTAVLRAYGCPTIKDGTEE